VQHKLYLAAAVLFSGLAPGAGQTTGSRSTDTCIIGDEPLSQPGGTGGATANRDGRGATNGEVFKLLNTTRLLATSGLVMTMLFSLAIGASAQIDDLDLDDQQSSAVEQTVDLQPEAGQATPAPADVDSEKQAETEPAQPAQLDLKAEASTTLSDKTKEVEPPKESPKEPTTKLSGGIIVFYRHRFMRSVPNEKNYAHKDYFEVYRLQLKIDSKLDRFGLHADGRIRDVKLQSYFIGTAWVEEAYGLADIVTGESEYGPLVLKVGKI